MAEKTGELERIDKIDAEGSRRYAEGRGTDHAARELAADVGPEPPETEQIKGQIEETRHQMGETIDAIQERLSFSNISDQVSEHVSSAVDSAKDAVYDATIGKAVYFMKNVGNEISGSSIVRTARKNPFPFVLIGLGAGLLAYQSFSGGSHRRPAGFTGRRRLYDESSSDSLTASQNRSRREHDSGPGMIDKVSNVAGAAYENVSGAVDTVSTKAAEYANQAYDKAGQMRIKAADTYDQYLQERPLALGAVALALGAAVGMAIPSTSYEGDLMGETRDELFQKAQEKAAGLLDKTKSAVADAGQAVKDETRNM